jgi:nucleoside-diphosphate-sugar epimerase
MQTILGSNGVIGSILANTLPPHTDRVRLVSRNPKLRNDSYEVMAADLTDFAQTSKAIEGSEVAYLVAGLKYDIKIWQVQWPLIMKNVIEACKKHGTKLVFFDNVYSYGKVDGWMTEDTPYNPCSKKGEVRAKIAQQIMDEAKAGNLKALIARAADFYGPNSPLSFVNVLVFENLKKSKKPQWMADVNTRHSFTYTPDAGKATAILGNTDSAYNQVWHVPGDNNALAGKEFISLAAQAFGKNPGDYMVLKEWMIRMVGLFNPIIKESVEMLYQNKFDYLFDSTKFQKAFNFKPITYSDGIVETANSMK